MSEAIEVDGLSEARQGKVDVYAEVSPEVKIRTKKMLMWLIIFAIVMLFGGITSALIVLYGKLMWVHITPPSWLWMSNALVVISSLMLILAVRSLKRGAQGMATALTAGAFVLGIAFVFTQNAAWGRLSQEGMGYTISQTDNGMASV
jgi:cytochrome c oxidase subunit III